MGNTGKRVLLISGPNVSLIGKRETEIYGTDTLDDIEQMVSTDAENHGFEVECFRSESEGEIISYIQEHGPKAAGVIINPGALTHYSIALRDCIAYIKRPVVEVHVSNLHKREEFRRHSVIAPVCDGQVTGLGRCGYFGALHYIMEKVEHGEKDL